MKGSRRFKMLYDRKNDIYCLTNGEYVLKGMEVQSVAERMTAPSAGKKGHRGLLSPLYGLIHIRKSFPGKVNSIVIPIA